MPASRILLGVIGRPHGVRGLVHITSHTADPAALADYGPLSDDRGGVFTLAWKGEGVAELTQHAGGVATRVADRDGAARLTNTRLYVDRARLPAPEDDEYYLADLIGLDAVDERGGGLGRVTAVHDHGAGAFLELGPTLMVPFTRAAVPEIDLEGGRLVVVVPEEVGPGNLAGDKRNNTPPPLEGGGWGEGSSAASDQCDPGTDPSPPPPSSRGGGVACPGCLP